MDKLQTRIRKVEEEHAGEVLSAHLSNHEQKRLEQALFLLGGISIADKISQALNSSAMRALIQFQDEKRYKALGFENFVDFLTNSEYAPMSKNQFYDRKAVLEKEGDATFDLLNDIGLSVRKRKLLGAGNIQIDGEKVYVNVVAGEGATKTEEIEITNRERLLQTLSAVADQAARLNNEVAKQKEKIQKGEADIERLQKKLDHGEFTGKGSAAHFEMYMRAFTALNQMHKFIKDLTAVEKAEIAEQSLVYLRSFNSALAGLAQAYGHKHLQIGFDEDAVRKPLAEMTDNERQAHIADKLKDFTEDDEFAAVTSEMNDEELAAMVE